jgi:hypothetical protein
MPARALAAPPCRREEAPSYDSSPRVEWGHLQSGPESGGSAFARSTVFIAWSTNGPVVREALWNVPGALPESGKNQAVSFAGGSQDDPVQRILGRWDLCSTNAAPHLRTPLLSRDCESATAAIVGCSFPIRLPNQIRSSGARFSEIPRQQIKQLMVHITQPTACQ